MCDNSQLGPPWRRSFWCPPTGQRRLCSSLVKLYINIYTLKLSPGTVCCKHHIVPQSTLMRMIYIYIAPFIPKDLRVPHRLKYLRLHHSNASWLWCEPARQEKCTRMLPCYLSKRRFWEVGQIFHPMQTGLELLSEIWSERLDMQGTEWSCALSAAGGTEMTLWWLPGISQKVGRQRKIVPN